MLIVLVKDAILNIMNTAEKARSIFKDIVSKESGRIGDNYIIYSAFNYSFLVFAQAILTLSNYLVVKRKTRTPKSFVESLSLLIEEGVIPEDLEEYVELLVNLRDSILHSDPERKIERIKQMIENFGKFEIFYESIVSEVRKIIGESQIERSNH